MQLLTESFVRQRVCWPESGRLILAQWDAESVVVYQAFRPEIGHFAARHGHFDGSGFGLRRMSWIKPNFLWMMYRSGWGMKEGQEVTLAIHLRRAAFDRLLASAVPSSFDPRIYPSQEAWQEAIETSDVRLQWDPDHEPNGAPLDRRAMQLGLRGAALASYAREWVLAIEDISPLVERERQKVAAGGIGELVTPIETLYPVPDANVAERLGLDQGGPVLRSAR